VKSQEYLKNLWSFNWDVMEVMMGGKSSIDLTFLQFRDWNEATDFLSYYGFDPDEPQWQKHIHSVFIESLNFIETYLMPQDWGKKGRQPPDEILNAADARSLLLMASDRSPEKQSSQLWACALLRVMHTISHIDGVQRLMNIDEARNQIKARFKNFVFKDNKQRLFLGTKDRNIEIDRIEWKDEKTRESIILKLLHKKANVAETIYDLLGVRIVTKHLSDTMVVVKFLRDFHMINFVNCNPARARNTLLNVDHFKHNVGVLQQMLEQDRISPDEFIHMVKRVTTPNVKTKSVNVHSGTNYRSIQLTCRQFIRCKNPFLGWRDKLEQMGASAEASTREKNIIYDILNLSRNWWQGNEQNEFSRFFPFEVQILDVDSAQQNQKGDSAHEKYKKSQIKAARRRVLGGMLTAKKPPKL